MEASELDYELPAELIAQHPADRRDPSPLPLFDRATGGVRHRHVSDLPDEWSGLVVVNDTRVVPARLALTRPGGGAAEVLLLERLPEEGLWEGLARPTRRLRPGMAVRPGELRGPLVECRWRPGLSGD